MGEDDPPPPQSYDYRNVVCVETDSTYRGDRNRLILMPWIELQKSLLILGLLWPSRMMLGWMMLKYVCLPYSDVFTQLLSCACPLKIFLLLSQAYYWVLGIIVCPEARIRI